MAGKRRTAAKSQKAKNGKLAFRLYITAGNSRSAAALANLTSICQQHFAGNYTIEVVDAVKHPRRAQSDGVTATPTLVKRFPAPSWMIAGDLCEDALILAEMWRKPAGRRTR